MVLNSSLIGLSISKDTYLANIIFLSLLGNSTLYEIHIYMYILCTYIYVSNVCVTWVFDW